MTEELKTITTTDEELSFLMMAVRYYVGKLYCDIHQHTPSMRATEICMNITSIGEISSPLIKKIEGAIKGDND